MDGSGAQAKSTPRLVASRYAAGTYRRACNALANTRLIRTGKLYGVTKAEWERRAEEARPFAEVVEAYYAEGDRVRAEVPYTAAWQAEHAKVDELAALVTAIMDIEAHSMTGIIIKAQALAAWGEVRGFKADMQHGIGKWGPKFAADVMRFAAPMAREA